MERIRIGVLNKFKVANRKERPNQSPNNGDMVDKAKRDVESEWVCDIYLIIELLSF